VAGFSCVRYINFQQELRNKMGYPITHEKPALKYGDSTADRFIHSEPMQSGKENATPDRCARLRPTQGEASHFFLTSRGLNSWKGF